ncbi:iron-containing alcohol dehydrogenase [Bacillus salitolerans]|uniref:Iron-containing alcohol dehydrogenase n=1 Tax=Bacillus salitolerans TaxID=1437434 RepID=A0ABW4LRM9_9BACI
MQANQVSHLFLRSAIYSGSNSRSLIPNLFHGLGSKKVVLYSDRVLKKIGLVDMVVELFNSSRKEDWPELVGIYLDIAPDAESKSVNKAAEFARTVGADSLLALGGGSVMDTVKGVKYLLHNGLSDIKKVMPRGIVYERLPNARRIDIPHIAVPTTAGTGSEVSPIAVIYNEDLHVKGNIINPFISADIAILDPELTTLLPPKITAFTGFDALTHAIEALVSPKATSITDAFALQAIRAIEKNLPIVVSNGEDVDARMEMLQASLMSITAFSFALHAIPIHNFAHAYGALFRIPHGLANAVFLPIVMEKIPNLYLPKVKQLAEALRVNLEHQDEDYTLSLVLEKIRSLQYQTGIPKDFKEFNLTEKDLERVRALVTSDPAAVAYPLSNDVIDNVGQAVVPLSVK